jgi:hypothetical protein
MRTLDLKLLRDLKSMKGQVVAVAAVLACGLAVMIMSRSLVVSLENTQENYYRSHHFGDLEVASRYEWYAVAENSGGTAKSPVWSFTTACTDDLHCNDNEICTTDSCDAGVCTFTPHVPRSVDYDGDGDADAADLDLFVMCMSGAGMPFQPGCGSRDQDCDGEVDQNDFGFFQGCLKGAGFPVEARCLD